MADVRISDATTATTGTVYVPGGAGGAPLKVATTAVGREVMGAASAAAARAALGLGSAATASASAFDAAGAATAAVVSHVADGNPHGQYARTAAANTFTEEQTVTGGGGVITVVAGGEVTVEDTAGVVTVTGGAVTAEDADGNNTAQMTPTSVSVGSPTHTTQIGAAASKLGTRGQEYSLLVRGQNANWDWGVRTLSTAPNGVVDDTLFIGSNYDPVTGQRQDTSEPSIHVALENRYKPAADATYTQSEYYVQYVNTAGATGRTYMTEVRNADPGGDSSSRVTNSFWGTQVFRRVSDDRQNWYLTDSGVFSTEYGRIDFGANNAATVRQRRAAGGDNWVSLAYLDSSDVLQLAVPSGGSRPVVNTDGRLTVGRTLSVTHADHPAAVPTVRVQSAAGATGLRVEDAGGQAVLLVSGDRTVTATAGYLMRLEGTLARANDSLFALQLAPAVSGDNGSSNHILLDVNPTVGAGTAPNSLALSRSYPVVNSGGTVPDVRCFDVQSAVVGSSTLTALYGYRYRDTFVAGGSALATQYGVCVDDLTGATTNYALHTGKGQHRIGAASDTKIAFFGATPVTKPAALTAADAGAVNTGDATSDTVIGNMRTRINELEARLQSLGLVT